MKKLNRFQFGAVFGLTGALSLVPACGDDGSTSVSGATLNISDSNSGGNSAGSTSNGGGGSNSDSDSSPTSGGGTDSGGQTTSTGDPTSSTGTGSPSTTAEETTSEDSTTTDGTTTEPVDTTGADTDSTTSTTGVESTSTTTTDGTSTSTSTSTTGGNQNQCQAPSAYIDCDGTPGNLTTDPFKALGINCGNDPKTTIVANSATMNATDPNSWRIVTAFGTANQGPGDNRYNGKLWAANLNEWVNPNNETIPNNTSTAILMLSTGVISQPNAQGVVTEPNSSQVGNNSNSNPDGGGLPAPLSALKGSNGGAGGTPFMNCDGVNDCSDSLYNHWVVKGWNNPQDKLWMQFELTVPKGTEGYVFDFAFFSSEYPSWYNTQYNDLFIAWSTSETYTGNITFVNGGPLTITSLEDVGAFQYKGAAPQFAGTGFDGHAATGWYTARGSAKPEETFQLTFFMADMGDYNLASAVLLDNFRWECKGCIPNEVESCGIAPQ